MIDTIELKANVKVRLTANFTALCPLSKTVDEYTVEIVYDGKGKFIELGSLRRYLDSFAGQEWFHEELCEKIREDLEKALEVPVKVKLVSNYLAITVEVQSPSGN